MAAEESAWVPPFTSPQVFLQGISEGFRGTKQTLETMRDAALGVPKGISRHEGAHMPEVRLLAQQVVSHVASKDYVGEAQAIFQFMHLNNGYVRYTLDPRGLEWVQTPWWTLKVIGQGDCIPLNTKVLLCEPRRQVRLDQVRVGDHVWGLHDWTKVTKTWRKGLLPTTRLRFTNGAELHLTEEHVVWVALCKEHQEPFFFSQEDGVLCDCGPRKRTLLEVKVEELELGMVVARPLSVPDLHPGLREELLRIEWIERGGFPFECGDLSTEDHHVYLPEADVTVHNCDDHATAICALAVSLGHGCAFRTVKGDPSRPDEFSHVYAVIGVKKNGRPLWLAADSTDPDARLGLDPPKNKVLGMQDWVVVPA